MTTEFSLAAANFHNRSQAGTTHNFLARDGLGGMYIVNDHFYTDLEIHTVQSVILRGLTIWPKNPEISVWSQMVR